MTKLSLNRNVVSVEVVNASLDFSNIFFIRKS